MSKVKVVLNKSGVRQLLQSQELQNVVAQRAQRVMSAIPVEKGYESETSVKGTRAVATIRATSLHAINDNKKNQTLLRGLNNARD